LGEKKGKQWRFIAKVCGALVMQNKFECEQKVANFNALSLAEEA
jgi:hypothetical protein